MTRIARVIPRRRAVVLVSSIAVLAMVVPLTVTATTASWPDQEWVHADGIGTSSLRCGVDTGFTSTASGDFLSGALLGTNLDNVAALLPQQLALSGDGTLSVSPAGSIDRGSTPPTYTYTNPLNLSLLGGVAGLNLTGYGAGLPAGSAGAVNQYAQVSGDGTAAGASGLVSDSGGVLVSESTPDDQLPEPATISLATLLPVVAGVAANPRVEIGAVGARSTLDGCAALRSSLWGDGSDSGVSRAYGIADLDLVVDSAVLSTIVTNTNSSVTNLNTAANGLLGPNGGIATAITGRLQTALAGLGLTLLPATGTVSLSGLNLSGAVSTLLTAPLDDGIVSINLAAGTVEVDLAALVSATNGLNLLAPNTELLLNAPVVNAIVDRISVLLNTRTQQITGALTTAIRNATLTVNLSVGLQLLGVQVATVGVGINATLGAVLDGTATITPTLTVLSGLPGVVQLALNAILGTVTAAVSGLATTLVTPLANTVSAALITPVNTLGTTLAAIVTPAVTALGALLAPLPGVLSVRVNVQPDQPNAPAGTTFVAGTATSTPEYRVSALRLGVGNGLGGLAFVEFGTASAGPVTAP